MARLTVARVLSPEEHEKLYRFRYRIYVEEMGIHTPEADSERGMLSDGLDESSFNFVLLEGDAVRGALRATRVSELSDPSALVEKFQMARAVEFFGTGAIITTSRFMLDPALRGGTAILRLLEATYELAMEHQVRLNFGDCSPQLLPFYEHLGFRRYTRAWNDTAYGFKMPILMLMRDLERFSQVRSPIRRLARRQLDDREAARWFETHYPEFLDEVTETLLPEGEFLDLLATRLADDPLHAIGLLRGISSDDAARLLRRATLVRAEPGDRILREGETGDTVYVLLSGIAEVYRASGGPEPVRWLGQGDVFGEIALLTASARTASVVASTACEALVLSGAFLEECIAREPATAATLLLNLSKLLAARLSDLPATPRSVPHEGE